MQMKEKIIHNWLAEDGVVSVSGVTMHELPLILSQCKSLASGEFPEEDLDTIDDKMCVFAVLDAPI